MDLSGAGQGAAEALERIVAQRLLRDRLEAEIADRNQRHELERQALEQRNRNEAADRAQRQQQLDMQAGDRRSRNNDRGVRRMLGEALTQGTGELGPDDRRSLAALQVEAGDAPTLLNAPKPERDPIADYRAKAAIDKEFREPPKPERGPGPYVVGGKLIGADGKVIYDGGNADVVDPTKAREKAQSMLDAAKSLRKHPGLGSLTGARIGNPDYALGVSQEPVAGTQAADAGSYFNQLKSLFTLDNIGLLKGVLSDSDMKILQQASTSLNTAMRDETFAAELDRVIQKLEGALGGGQGSVNLQPMDPTSSRGTGRTVDPRVDALIKKYGGGGV